MAGVEREIDEELNIGGGHTNKIVALLNDDSNPKLAKSTSASCT